MKNKEKKEIIKTFKVSNLLKVGIIFGFVVAVIECIVFIPFAWNIWWFNRSKGLFQGTSETNRVSMMWVSLFFLGIIPGILILIDNQLAKKRVPLLVETADLK